MPRARWVSRSIMASRYNVISFSVKTSSLLVTALMLIVGLKTLCSPSSRRQGTRVIVVASIRFTDTYGDDITN